MNDFQKHSIMHSFLMYIRYYSIHFLQEIFLLKGLVFSESFQNRCAQYILAYIAPSLVQRF